MGDYVVYIHQNKINGKRYVGITNNTSRRWCKKGERYENCPRFAAAIRKYGWDNFYHVVIVRGLTLEEANVLERFYIREYRTNDKAFGYNMTCGGQNAPTMTGRHHSEETKKKMREAALGRVISDDQRRRHSEVMTGKMVGPLNHKSRPVCCIDTGEVFETQRAAAKATGAQQAKISLCCQGKRNRTHGMRWEYADKMEA